MYFLLVLLSLVPLAHPQSTPSLCSLPLTSLDPAACPSDAQCDSHDLHCVTCQCPGTCTYGDSARAQCTVLPDVPCLGNRTFPVEFDCAYCFQSDPENFHCEENYECNSVAPGQDRFYKANCTMRPDHLCLGRRQFLRQTECNWTRGHVWLTALLLSIGCGGFGFDRFYLGHWQEGIGKLFSFGGLGVWTLVDVVLVSMRYVGPADGSLYIF